MYESVEVGREGICILFDSGRKGACDVHESEWDPSEGDFLCARNGQIDIANRVVEKYDLGGENSGCPSISVGLIIEHGES